MAANDPNAEPDPLLGRLIGDRYRVLAPLGRGGMGAVYRVEHTMMKKELALKLLHPELGRLEEVAKRFEREAEAAARLDHPHIITVTDFGRTSDGMLFLVMELLSGPSLAEVLRPAGGPGRALGAARAVHILEQVLRALDKAHSAGIIHRDLKPENIVLVERDGDPDFVKLLDFGIAKITHGESARESLTQAGMVFGTPEYLSPEQAMGEEADGRADLYAAGVMLYEMLAGRRPFEAASKVEVLSMHLTREPEPMHKVAPGADIPPALERVVERAMAKKRSERFESAAAFLKALDEAGRPAAGGSAGIDPKAWLQSARRVWPWLVSRAREAGVPWPRAFIAGGAALACVLLALVAVSRRVEKPRPPAPEIAEDLKHVEQLLARGQLEPARAALQQLEADHPDSARVHDLFGNLDYAEGDRGRALDDYRAAIQLDKGYRADPLLLANVRSLLERRVEGPDALALLGEIGKPALPALVDCAKTCKDPDVRAGAAKEAIRLGGPALIAAEGHPVGEVSGDTLDRLRHGRTCRERKPAALEVIATGNREYLDELKAARARRGGFLGIQAANGCMLRELDAAIRKLEAQK